MYNFIQCFTKSNNLVVNHVYNFPESAPKSGNTMIVYCILCKYVIQSVYRSYTPTCYYVCFLFYVYTTILTASFAHNVYANV